jgi:hypothetical protein
MKRKCKNVKEIQESRKVFCVFFGTSFFVKAKGIDVILLYVQL